MVTEHIVLNLKMVLEVSFPDRIPSIYKCKAKMIFALEYLHVTFNIAIIVSSHVKCTHITTVHGLHSFRESVARPYHRPWPNILQSQSHSADTGINIYPTA